VRVGSLLLISEACVWDIEGELPVVEVTYMLSYCVIVILLQV
jgi:hypothetical protein